jgi:flagellar protein FliO/FliZ
LSSFFSSDGPFSLQFAIIFAIIFLVLAAGLLVLRRFTGRGTDFASKTAARGRQPRLGIVDIYELDRQRQLILLRRDNVEHLLLVGGPNDVVVERNITRGMNARLATEETAYDEPAEPVQDMVAPIAQRPGPQVDFPQASPPQALPPQASAMGYREPSFEMPLVVPAPMPGSEAIPAVARPLDLPPQPAPEDLFRPAPPSEAPPRKESQLARVIRRAPPSLVNLVPAALAERVRMPVSQPEPAPAPIPEAPAPVVAPPATRAIDAAILSDMARQLEEALRRPSAAVRPAAPEPMPSEAPHQPDTPHAAEAGHQSEPPAQPEPEPVSHDAAQTAFAPPPEPVLASAPDHPRPAESVDPIAAAMAATAAQPEPTPEQALDESLFREAEPATHSAMQVPEPSEPVFVDLPAPEAAVAVTPDEEPVIHAVVADAPRMEEPVPAPPVAEDPLPTPPEPPVPAPAPASPNPFSVEEIEAEFARLLGRPLDRKH